VSVKPVIRRVAALHCPVTSYDWAFARDEAQAIADHWRKRLAQQPRMFDGPVLLQHTSEIVEERGVTVMRAQWFEASYAAFTAWIDFGFPDPRARNGFSMAALRAQDGFVLAEMGAHTANAGRIYFPAGTPDPGDVAQGQVDLEASVLRELREETGLSPDELTIDPDWLVVDAGPYNACMKLMRSPLPAIELAAEIERRIARQGDPELARMHVVRSAADLVPQRMHGFTLAFLEEMLAQPG